MFVVPVHGPVPSVQVLVTLCTFTVPLPVPSILYRDSVPEVIVAEAGIDDKSNVNNPLPLVPVAPVR
jgi:hypothetical protein